MPLDQGPDLILDRSNRLPRGNGIETTSVQPGFAPVAGQFEPAFPALDFESKKLEAWVMAPYQSLRVCVGVGTSASGVQDREPGLGFGSSNRRKTSSRNTRAPSS